MEILATIWFVLIVVLWIGYMFLDGFDLGVGMMMPFLSRSERGRRVLLNSIGPVWDGNEVWLITAAGAMFAAFPHWYASLFSALYIPLTLCLLGLIFRAVSIEYRGKGHTQAWKSFWTWAMAVGSAVTAFCIGAMLAMTTTGLPLNGHGDIVGGPFAWVSWPALLGGLGGSGSPSSTGSSSSDSRRRERSGPGLSGGPRVPCRLRRSRSSSGSLCPSRTAPWTFSSPCSSGSSLSSPRSSRCGPVLRSAPSSSTGYLPADRTRLASLERTRMCCRRRSMRRIR